MATVHAGQRIKEIIGEAAISAFVNGEAQPVVDTLAMLSQLEAEALGQLAAVFDEARTGEPLPDLMRAWAEVAIGDMNLDERLLSVNEMAIDAEIGPDDGEIPAHWRSIIARGRLRASIADTLAYRRSLDLTFITHQR